MYPLLSVVVPLYNSARYIEKCLESILNSTYQNLDVIVIDDGSVDCGIDIVRKISQKDKRLRFFAGEKNKGVSAARNKGIKESRGHYLTFVDSDDYVENTTFSIVVRALQEKNSDAAIYTIVREQENHTIYESMPWENGTVLGKERIRNELIPLTLAAKRGQTWVSGSVWRLVFKREKLTVEFDENVRYREDQLFCINSYLKLSSIVVCDQARYHYVKHGITTTEKFRSNFFCESMECEEKIIKVLEANKIFDKVYDHYVIQRLSTYSLCVSNLFRYDAPENIREELQAILCSFKNDPYMRWNLKKVLGLSGKYMLVLALLALGNANLIYGVYTKKEKQRQKKLMR